MSGAEASYRHFTPWSSADQTNVIQGEPVPPPGTSWPPLTLQLRAYVMTSLPLTSRVIVFPSECAMSPNCIVTTCLPA